MRDNRSLESSKEQFQLIIQGIEGTMTADWNLRGLRQTKSATDCAVLERVKDAIIFKEDWNGCGLKKGEAHEYMGICTQGALTTPFKQTYCLLLVCSVIIPLFLRFGGGVNTC